MIHSYVYLSIMWLFIVDLLAKYIRDITAFDLMESRLWKDRRVQCKCYSEQNIQIKQITIKLYNGSLKHI